MWLTIDYFRPEADLHAGLYDLLVRRRGRVVRVPDCHWSRGWRTRHYDRLGRSRLRPGDVPIYFMRRPEWPTPLKHRRG